MLDFPDLPTFQSIYVLHFFLSHPQALVIGRLEQQRLLVGHYFYLRAERVSSLPLILLLPSCFLTNRRFS